MTPIAGARTEDKQLIHRYQHCKQPIINVGRGDIDLQINACSSVGDCHWYIPIQMYCESIYMYILVYTCRSFNCVCVCVLACMFVFTHNVLVSYIHVGWCGYTQCAFLIFKNHLRIVIFSKVKDHDADDTSVTCKHYMYIHV